MSGKALEDVTCRMNIFAIYADGTSATNDLML